MTRLPDRERVKEDFIIYVDEYVLGVADAYTYHYSNTFRSKSQFIESLIFLAYINFVQVDSPINFFNMLLEAEKQHKLENAFTNFSAKNKSLHVKLDSNAKDFVFSVVRQYPSIFKSNAHFITMILLYASQYIETDETMKHFIARLEETKRKYPTRKNTI